MHPNKKWLQQELKQMHLPKAFVKSALNDYDTETFETVLRLNLLGFLQPPQHMDRVSREAARETLSFLKENKTAFLQAEEKYKVPPSVISALLWIETRHGDDRGDFHTVSVYLHLLQSNRSPVQKQIYKLAVEKNKKQHKYLKLELKRIMAERTKKKSQWAREQIQALADIYKKRQLDLHTLKGSFAGAFGLCQFIPSSYRDFAKPAKPPAAPDLYNPNDAIMSVAFYLKKHGWKERLEKSKILSLMKYNNSRDYADSILEISKQAQSLEQKNKDRELSSVTSPDGG